MFKSEIRISGSNDLVSAYLAALDPEKDFKTERAQYELKKIKGGLLITIQAKDATAFRAVTNSITGLITIVEKNIWQMKK